MRRLTPAIAIALLALASLSFNSNAARRARDCPAINISCPDVIHVGVPVTFTAAVSNLGSNSKLTYKWTVSAGTIMSGQGTNSIVVDTTRLTGETFTATVEVTGLPESCPNSSSCSTSDYMPLIDDCCKVDEYGNLRFSAERFRLDHFALLLSNDPASQGYLLCYGGRIARESEAQRRCARAKDYLIGTRGIDASRVVTINGGYQESLTVALYMVPVGKKPPIPSPTVNPKEVRIIKGGAKSRRRH